MLEIKKTQSNDVSVLSLSGRLDTITASKLQEALSEVFTTASKIELDLSELVYISSAGLRVLLLGEKQSKASGKTMTLKNVLPDVMEVFDITGFSSILSIM